MIIPKSFKKFVGSASAFKKLDGLDWRKEGRTLTYWLHRWVRLRDTEVMTNGRYGNCICCGRHKAFEQLEAGHFIRSRHMGTRWHEKNINAQCSYCNRWLGGNELKYREGLIKKYGPGIIDELEVEKKLNARHPDAIYLKLRAVRYRMLCEGIEG